MNVLARTSYGNSESAENRKLRLLRLRERAAQHLQIMRKLIHSQSVASACVLSTPNLAHNYESSLDPKLGHQFVS